MAVEVVEGHPNLLFGEEVGGRIGGGEAGQAENPLIDGSQGDPGLRIQPPGLESDLDDLVGFDLVCGFDLDLTAVFRVSDANPGDTDGPRRPRGDSARAVDGDQQGCLRSPGGLRLQGDVGASRGDFDIARLDNPVCGHHQLGPAVEGRLDVQLNLFSGFEHRPLQCQFDVVRSGTLLADVTPPADMEAQGGEGAGARVGDLDPVVAPLQPVEGEGVDPAAAGGQRAPLDGGNVKAGYLVAPSAEVVPVVVPLLFNQDILEGVRGQCGSFLVDADQLEAGAASAWKTDPLCC